MNENLKVILGKSYAGQFFDFLARNGQSFIANYGDDTEAWEVSWITDGGKRFNGNQYDLFDAIGEAVKKASEHDGIDYIAHFWDECKAAITGQNIVATGGSVVSGVVQIRK